MTEERRRLGGSYRVAWMVLLGISALLVVVGLLLFFLPEADRLVLPDARSSRLLGMATVAIGILSASIIWYGIRDGSPLSVRIMWTLPVVAAGIAAVFLIGDDYVAAAVYAGMAALATWMQVILERRVW